MRSPRLAVLAGVIGAALVTAVAVAACTPVPVAVVTPTVAPTASADPASPSPTPTPEPDPALTKQVCHEASSATAVTESIYIEQIAALEQAAAQNDQVTMVKSAESINRQFIALSESLTVLSQRPVTPELKTVLTDIATALKQMSSLAYTGTMVDIRKKLLDFATAFQHTCPPDPAASPSG